MRMEKKNCFSFSAAGLKDDFSSGLEDDFSSGLKNFYLERIFHPD